MSGRQLEPQAELSLAPTETTPGSPSSHGGGPTLKWSNKLPDQEGWWWNRTAPGHWVMPTKDADEACVCVFIFKPEGGKDFEILAPNGLDHTPVQSIRWQQWAGPIPLPTD